MLGAVQMHRMGLHPRDLRATETRDEDSETQEEGAVCCSRKGVIESGLAKPLVSEGAAVLYLLGATMACGDVLLCRISPSFSGILTSVVAGNRSGHPLNSQPAAGFALH